MKIYDFSIVSFAQRFFNHFWYEVVGETHHHESRSSTWSILFYMFSVGATFMIFALIHDYHLEFKNYLIFYIPLVLMTLILSNVYCPPPWNVNDFPSIMIDCKKTLIKKNILMSLAAPGALIVLALAFIASYTFQVFDLLITWQANRSYDKSHPNLRVVENIKANHDPYLEEAEQEVEDYLSKINIDNES